MYINFDKEYNSAVIRIGIDIVNSKRFSSMKPTIFERFAKRILCDEEFSSLKKDNNKPLRLAVLFSAKESVAKAFGCGFVGINFKDIMILKNEKNRPTVWLSENAAVLAKSLNIQTVKLSISHEKDYVITQVIAY